MRRSIKIWRAMQLSVDVFVVSMLAACRGQTITRTKRKAMARSTMIADLG